jgi:E3 ubiquitin-protein ligase RNF11
MVDFEPEDELRYLPCTHHFHRACIDRWLNKSFTCPSCVEPINLD